MRDSLHLGEFAILVQQDVEVPLALEVAQPPERERFRRAIRDDGENLVEVLEVFLDGGDGVEWLALVRSLGNICKGFLISRQYTLSQEQVRRVTYHRCRPGKRHLRPAQIVFASLRPLCLGSPPRTARIGSAAPRAPQSRRSFPRAGRRAGRVPSSAARVVVGRSAIS